MTVTNSTRVQRELAATPGVTVLIYDQTCANEKRRRRKRGEYPDPDKRVFINERVCEGCGDCGVQSNCVSIQPLETEFGRKRVIDQSNCNKDFSCVDGFCPSFVTVHGAQPKKPPAQAAILTRPHPPRPEIPQIGPRPYGILVTGVGGTGVVTIGAILGMAAHIEGKGCASMDMAGLAQKGGARAEPCQDRGRAWRHPRHPRRRRRGRSHSRLRSRRRRLGRGPRRDPQGRHRRPRQHRRDLSGRIHARSRLHVARRGDQARDPPGRGRRARASSTRPPWRRRCSAIRSRPICSCSAMPGSRACCLSTTPR